MSEQEKNLRTLRRFPQPPENIIYCNSSGNPYPELIQKAIRRFPDNRVCRYAGCPICKDVPNRNIEIWKCDARIPRAPRKKSAKKRKSKTLHIKLHPGLKINFH